MTASFRLALAHLALAATLTLAACGPSSTVPLDNGTPEPARGGVTLVAVPMAPQAPAVPPFGSLPLPASAGVSSSPRQASFTWDEMDRNGAAYNNALPAVQVTPDLADPTALVFSPGWSGNGLAGAAYCLYDFALPGLSDSTEPQTLGVNCELPAVQHTLWIGLANRLRGAWDWYEGPDDSVLTLDSWAHYQDASGNILAAVVVLGGETLTLRSLHIGQQELRGLGDFGLPDGALATMPPITSWPVLTDKVDLSPYCAPVNDQGLTGGCTAFASADSDYNYELGRTYGPYGWDFTDPFNRCSPRYVYNQTGIDLGGSVPTGSRRLDSVCAWLLSNGTATELNAPTGTTMVPGYNTSSTWNADALTDAALLSPETRTFIGSYADGDYWWADEDIDSAKHVLKDLKHVIAFRTDVDSNFQYVNYAGGKAWTYNGSSIGGHAMCIVGYDTGKDGGKGAFKVRNSWGKSWGASGYCWVSFETMKDFKAGVYGYYFEEDYSNAVRLHFLPDSNPIFWVSFIRIPLHKSDRISIEWDAVDGAMQYQLFRDSQEQPLIVLDGQQSSYDDIDLADFDAHIYWLRAVNNQGMPSEFSLPVVGWRVPQ
jgi:hypothetical protein